MDWRNGVQRWTARSRIKYGNLSLEGAEAPTRQQKLEEETKLSKKSADAYVLKTVQLSDELLSTRAVNTLASFHVFAIRASAGQKEKMVADR